MKKRFLFIGDNHCDTKVSSRIDDYLQACVQETKECLLIAKKLQVDAAIFLGDVFNKMEVRGECRNAILSTLASHKGEPWPFRKFVVVGNHDIGSKPHWIHKSSLGTLIKANVLECVDEVPEYKMKFLHFTPHLDANLASGLCTDMDYSIIAAHASVSTQPLIDQDYILFKKLELHDNTKLFFSGHIHAAMEQTRTDGKCFINPGNVGRNSLKKENISRDIQVVAVEFDYDTNTFERKYFKLSSSKPANEIFDLERHAEEKAQEQRTQEFISEIYEFSNTAQYSNDAIEDLRLYAKQNAVDPKVLQIMIETLQAVQSEDSTD